MHIVHAERQTDHKLRVQCQNSNKGREVQVSAQNIQQYTDSVLCCNVNNKNMLGKQEQNERRIYHGKYCGWTKQFTLDLSFKNFPVAPTFATAIPEVQGANVIPMSVQRQHKEKRERMRETLSVP